MKNLTISIQALLFIFLTVNILSSQSRSVEPTYTASVNVADFENELSTLFDSRTFKSISKNKLATTREIYYDISNVDLSTKINVLSNEMDFSGVENNKYTEVQLTHKGSNKTVLSRKIESNYKIDLNMIVPGTYILMLSNEKGNLKSEEITVI